MVVERAHHEQQQVVEAAAEANGKVLVEAVVWSYPAHH